MKVALLDRSGNLRRLEDIEAEIVRCAVERCRSQSEAARQLGISRGRLVRKLRRKLPFDGLLYRALEALAARIKDAAERLKDAA